MLSRGEHGTLRTRQSRPRALRSGLRLSSLTLITHQQKCHRSQGGQEFQLQQEAGVIAHMHTHHRKQAQLLCAEQLSTVQMVGEEQLASTALRMHIPMSDLGRGPNEPGNSGGWMEQAPEWRTPNCDSDSGSSCGSDSSQQILMHTVYEVRSDSQGWW